MCLGVGVELLHSSSMMALGDFRNPHNAMWLVHVAGELGLGLNLLVPRRGC